jgi:hypothetical protein
MARRALHIQARVQPGNRVDVHVPEPLKVGDEVDVVVLTPETGDRAPRGRSILEILDGLPPNIGMFKTAKEVDEYIREERDSWDR